MRSSAAFAVDARTLGLYVHWPFCRSKCPYCDFNSHVETAIDQRRWRDALVAEIRHFAALTPGRRLQTIFFGGGTPSLMPPETVAAVIETARACWETARDIEITLEANPTSVEAARLSSYRAAGVGRLSLGVQSLDAEGLAALGREHGVDESDRGDRRRARPVRTRLVRPDIRPAGSDQTRLAPGAGARARTRRHPSLGLSAHHRARHRVPRAASAGASSFCRPTTSRPGSSRTRGRCSPMPGCPPTRSPTTRVRAKSARHNLIYWLSADYAGVGPGAHGRIAGEGRTTAFAQRRAPEAWRAAVETAGHATVSETVLEPSERLEEIAMMGLRLTDGIPRFRLAALTGRQPEALFDAAALERLSCGRVPGARRPGLARDAGRTAASGRGARRPALPRPPPCAPQTASR